jgi:hypothetical protein
MAEIVKPKILILLDAKSEQASFDRLQKALSGFCEVSTKKITPETLEQEIVGTAAEISNIFIDHQLVNMLPYRDPNRPITIILLQEIPLKELYIKKVDTQWLERHSTICINGISTGDLFRLLHNYLTAERTPGILSLLEKGSLVVGEKIQSLTNIGELLDFLTTYLQKTFPQIALRSADIRQVITSLVSESMAKLSQEGIADPTIDIQGAANEGKFAFTLRFPLGKTKLSDITNHIYNGSSLPWQICWQSSDALTLVWHKKFNELEVKAVILSKAPSAPCFKSLLFTELSGDQRAEKLLVVPKHYSFSLISDLRSFKGGSSAATATVTTIVETEADQEDEKFSQERTQLNQVIEQKLNEIRELANRINQLKNEVAKSKNMSIQLLREKEQIIKQKTNRITELESNIASNQKIHGGSTAEISTQTQAVIKELDTKVKILEADKTKSRELLGQAQKKISILEQKISTKDREGAQKDRELGELKSQVHKLQAQIQKKDEAAASHQTHAVDKKEQRLESQAEKEALMKMREFEQKETAYKQEIKKLQFKADSTDKTIKGIKDEAAEKIKLMEKKLEAAKTKEIDLLKKIDELNSTIKKNNRAA